MSPTNPPSQAQHQPSPANTRKTTLALQWNISGFHNNIADLELLVVNAEPMVIALQEIHKITPDAMDHSVAIGVLEDISSSKLTIDA